MAVGPGQHPPQRDAVALDQQRAFHAPSARSTGDGPATSPPRGGLVTTCPPAMSSSSRPTMRSKASSAISSSARRSRAGSTVRGGGWWWPNRCCGDPLVGAANRSTCSSLSNTIRSGSGGGGSPMDAWRRRSHGRATARRTGPTAAGQAMMAGRARGLQTITKRRQLHDRQARARSSSLTLAHDQVVIRAHARCPLRIGARQLQRGRVRHRPRRRPRTGPAPLPSRAPTVGLWVEAAAVRRVVVVGRDIPVHGRCGPWSFVCRAAPDDSQASQRGGGHRGFLVLQAAASPRSRQDGPVSRCASAARLPDGVVMPAG